MLPINVNLPLKSVTDRVRSCRAVLWAITTFGDRLVEKLGEMFGPLLVEGQLLPFDVTLELFRKKLTQHLDRLVATDRGYRDQKARESVARTHKDELVGQVNFEVVGLRQAFTGLYSEEKLAEFGFARRTPQQSGGLLEQATHLVARLGDPELDLTGSRFGDYQLDASKLAEALVKSVGELEPMADELAREERQTEALKLAKDDALEEYNLTFQWIARTVESLCRLAGLDEVANRIRPSVRRPGVTARRAGESDDPPAVGDTPAANDEATEVATDPEAETPAAGVAVSAA